MLTIKSRPTKYLYSAVALAIAIFCVSITNNAPLFIKIIFITGGSAGFIFSVLSWRSYIILNSNELIYFNGIQSVKKVSVDSIGFIGLRAANNSASIVLKNKDNSKILVRFYTRGSVFSMKDLTNVIREILKINPSITLSPQAKNMLDGKFWYTIGLKDN